MKILIFEGGLGNQIIDYAFCTYLRLNFPNEKIYGIYDQKRMSEHYGLEIDKWFDVNLPPSVWFAKPIQFSIRFLKKVFRVSKWFDYSDRLMTKPNAKLYVPFKLDKKYFPKGDWLKFKIDRNKMSADNKHVLSKIENSNSYFIHVRRGDYLKENVKELYGNICTKEYYLKAINMVKKIDINAIFFVFSDDISWVKDNLKLEDPIYIDWNTGINSPIDMFLMSRCKGAIIANSTFSYWAARIGVKKDLIIHPSKWFNNHPSGNPDMFENDWIAI